MIRLRKPPDFEVEVRRPKRGHLVLREIAHPALTGPAALHILMFAAPERPTVNVPAVIKFGWAGLFPDLHTSTRRTDPG